MPKAYLIGSGIGSLASAAYLIRDGKIPGENIHIFEEANDIGGSLDAAGSPEKGYSMRGGRMFEKHFGCTYDLLSFIPTLSDPSKTIKEETFDFHTEYSWYNKCRLVENGKIVNFRKLQLSLRDRLDLAKMFAISESMLGVKQIKDCFRPAFFKTNFWFMWATTFAFEPWHSAVELRRYMLRFVHLFSTIDVMTGIIRTRFNQYDAIVRPMVKWMEEKKVNFSTNSRVVDLIMKVNGDGKTVERIIYTKGGKNLEISVASDDLVFITNGSMTADSSVGSMTSAPVLNTKNTSGSWLLWQKMAKGNPEFGNPSVFCEQIDKTKWESFTVTCKDPTFFSLMQEFSGSEAGKGGLITFKDSNWLMTIVLNHQPHFIEQPSDVLLWWGYGLFPEKEGNFIKKKMCECTGEEILTEVLSHLKFDKQKELILKTSNCIPCMMPYITSQFMPRRKGDRPQVVPKGATNFAFIGQYCEIPDDVVFTVEYSVRAAQIAVYNLLKLNKTPVRLYKGQTKINVLFDSTKTLFTK